MEQSAGAPDLPYVLTSCAIDMIDLCQEIQKHAVRAHERNAVPVTLSFAVSGTWSFSVSDHTYAAVI